MIHTKPKYNAFSLFYPPGAKCCRTQNGWSYNVDIKVKVKVSGDLLLSPSQARASAWGLSNQALARYLAGIITSPWPPGLVGRSGASSPLRHRLYWDLPRNPAQTRLFHHFEDRTESTPPLPADRRPSGCTTTEGAGDGSYSPRNLLGWGSLVHPAHTRFYPSVH